MGAKRRAAAARPTAERILVPLDFSRGAERALGRAAQIAVAPGCEVHLLHVLAPESDAAAQDRAEYALSRARSVIRGVAAERCRVDSQVRSGTPYIEIIRRARESGAGLIVLGRNRPPGLLGTTLTRVVHLSDVPTLVVSRRALAPYRHPLVAVEIDPYARSLIELACRFSSGPEAGAAQIRVVHAYRVPFASAHRASADGSAAFYARQSRLEAEQSVGKLLDELSPHPCELQALVRSGDPQSVIAREASRYQADLVILGTHGRSGIAHVLLGSIAEWAVANLRRDVLLARPVRFRFVPP